MKQNFVKHKLLFKNKMFKEFMKNNILVLVIYTTKPQPIIMWPSYDLKVGCANSLGSLEKIL
jgi:hypothetical protein